jgi:aminoglycoside phosphotransferase (APT) family kinase protein
MIGMDNRFILSWLKNNSYIFGQNITVTDVTDLKSGEYNINYLIITNSKKYVLRLNIEPQSGLSNQIEYEFKTLKYLEPYGITPKAYYYSMDKSILGHPFLVMEFIEGTPVKLSDAHIIKTAKSLWILHSIKIARKENFMIRKSIVDDLDAINILLQKYLEAGNNSRILRYVKTRIKRGKNFKSTYSLVHTDVVPSNFIVNDKCFIIDWEKARVDDPSYDIAIFFSRFMYWDWEASLNEQQIQLFIDNYPGFKYDCTLMDKIQYRSQLINCLGLLWAATRLLDYDKLDPRVASNKTRYEDVIEYILSSP